MGFSSPAEKVSTLRSQLSQVQADVASHPLSDELQKQEVSFQKKIIFLVGFGGGKIEAEE